MEIKNLSGILFLSLVFTILNCSNKQESKEDKYSLQRKAMVEDQIMERGIKNKQVLDAFLAVPRHKFVPEKQRSRAYDDSPLSIGHNQTISQPYIVAYMTEILNPDKSKKVLEIGTGSGYQAAILSSLYKEVFTIEIIAALGETAKKVLEEEGFNNIRVKIGDGYLGWKEYSPFDAIIVTCAPENIPQPLVDQLAEGGRMIIPAGTLYNQVLYLLEKRKGKIIKTGTLPVLFVPMTRESKSEK